MRSRSRNAQPATITATATTRTVDSAKYRSAPVPFLSDDAGGHRLDTVGNDGTFLRRIVWKGQPPSAGKSCGMSETLRA
jgi:hypothetical protein